jgi:hypothetical protein
MLLKKEKAEDTSGSSMILLREISCQINLPTNMQEPTA